MGVGTFTIEDCIGIITIDSPPVNALSIRVRRALDEGFRTFAENDAVKAIVLICGGRTFIAGADISELDRPEQKPQFKAVCDIIENASKPVVAAIHGSALGGGYELALVCHYRVALASAKVGLPEVKLGLLPGGGGTQRLPRILGAAAALDIILSGAPVPAEKALELGMIDALAQEGRLKKDAIAFARRILAENPPLRRVRDRQDKVNLDYGDSSLFDRARKKLARTSRGLKAPENIIKAIQAAVELPFRKGMEREAELFRELQNSDESAAQRHYFFAEREVAKIPDAPASTYVIPVKTVGVVGGGTMGGGITMDFLNAGLPVTLVEMHQDALDRSLSVIRSNYENMVKKGRMTQKQAEKRIALITPAFEIEAVSDVDLVIEAVFEQMSVKKDIFTDLDRITKQGAILASTTSFLDVDEIARTTERPESVIGLHFFSPVHVMRLLEVVRGEATSKEIIATTMKLAKQIGKVPVLSRVCYGFIANRVMSGRQIQAHALILEGVTPKEVDKALFDYGFGMEPFQMMGLADRDVIEPAETEPILHGDLVQLGRPGGRSAGEIIARLLYPVVNEGAKILEERIALRASDIDVACILGYSWPAYTGGPMFWADTVGLPHIVAKLKELEKLHGGEFTPAKLLKEKATTGGSFTGNE